MITSVGLHAFEMKEKVYKKKMRISKAKHKLKGFTRALIASGSNLKYYFKQKSIQGISSSGAEVGGGKKDGKEGRRSGDGNNDLHKDSSTCLDVLEGVVLDGGDR